MLGSMDTDARWRILGLEGVDVRSGQPPSMHYHHNGSSTDWFHCTPNTLQPLGIAFHTSAT